MRISLVLFWPNLLIAGFVLLLLVLTLCSRHWAIAKKLRLWLVKGAFFFLAICLVNEFLFAPSIGIFNPYTEKIPEHFVLTPDNPISMGHGFRGLSSSNVLVDVLSYGVHFRIPRNYFTNASRESYEHTGTFTLVTRYPDFVGSDTDESPTFRHTEKEKAWSWASSNVINIVTVGGALGKSSEMDYNRAVLNSEANEPDHPAEYGLLRSTKSMSAIDQDVYFKRPSKENPETVIFCSRGKDSIGDCNLYLRVSNNLLLYCQFHRELLPHWQEINQGLIHLIRSFVVKEN